ncbi:MAG TPA: flagellar motor protein MotB [Bdellovibrionota bacterium]|jgi:chemotaxis protein MotB|nr:flagellar motor protein MotB [Bdellovibrionota bacterium]
MASADKAPIIVIKKKKAGGHGHHGGAWKVAYADFVTAMMAFFLVLWLLGSDEQTRESIASYFNNPTSAWRPDLQNKNQAPLGEMTGPGENLLTGANGAIPEDLIERPSKPRVEEPPGTEKLGKENQGLSKDIAPPGELEVEIMRFAVPEAALFEAGSTRLAANAGALLDRFAKFLRQFKGSVKVSAFLTPDPGAQAHGDAYEFAMARAVAVADYMVEKHWVDRGRASPQVLDRPGRGPAAAKGTSPAGSAPVEALPEPTRREIELTFGNENNQ